MPMGTTEHDIIKTPHALTRDLVLTVQRAIGVKPSRRQAIEFLLNFYKANQDTAK